MPGGAGKRSATPAQLGAAGAWIERNGRSIASPRAGVGPTYFPMRRLLLVVGYAVQACLGLAVIGVAAASQLAEAPRASVSREAQGPLRGPSLP